MTDFLTQLGLVQSNTDSLRERQAISRLDQKSGLTIGANHFGQRATGSRHQGHPTAHQLYSGQREPFVKRRDDTHLCFIENFDEALVTDPFDESDSILNSQLLDRASRGTVRPQLADHHEVNIAVTAQHCQGFQQELQPLHRRISTRGCHQATLFRGYMRQRSKQRLIHTDRNHMHPIHGNLVVAMNIGKRILRDGDQARDVSRNSRLHIRKRVPAVFEKSLTPVACSLPFQTTVHSGRVVNRPEHREAGPLEAQQPRTQGLIILRQIKIIDSRNQGLTSAHTESQRLRKLSGQELSELYPVPPGLHLMRSGQAQRVLFIIKVEAGQRM